MRPLSKAQSEFLCPVSLIATLMNEIDSVPQWVEYVLKADRQPDEIILVDGGSDDGTYETLIELAKSSPVPFLVYHHPGVNIARGRNIAISRAEHPIIACTDFGSLPRKDWLAKLVLPFEDNPDIQVVAGWYIAVGRDGSPLVRRRWPRLDQINLDDFIPSSRSLAFKKSTWEVVGGYPEWLTRTGEDTVFALELKKQTNFWAFVPDAVVEWHAPDDLLSYWRKQYDWSVGDGEAGINTGYYQRTATSVTIPTLAVVAGSLLLAYAVSARLWLLLILLLLTATISAVYIALTVQRKSIKLAEVPWELGAIFAQLFGYIRGITNRRSITQPPE